MNEHLCENPECRAVIVARPNEGNWKANSRRFCCRPCYWAAYHRRNKEALAGIMNAGPKEWPATVRFDSVAEKPDYTPVRRPATYMHGVSTAALAVNNAF